MRPKIDSTSDRCKIPASAHCNVEVLPARRRAQTLRAVLSHASLCGVFRPLYAETPAELCALSRGIMLELLSGRLQPSILQSLAQEAVPDDLLLFNELQELVAVIVDLGVLYRGAFAKYVVAFERISISSFALASSFRSRLFSASSSLIGRVTRAALTSLPLVSTTPSEPRLRRLQFPNVATGTPSVRAASCCPTVSALTSLTCNPPYEQELAKFLLYAKSSQGHPHSALKYRSPRESRQRADFPT